MPAERRTCGVVTERSASFDNIETESKKSIIKTLKTSAEARAGKWQGKLGSGRQRKKMEVRRF